MKKFGLAKFFLIIAIIFGGMSVPLWKTNACFICGVDPVLDNTLRIAWDQIKPNLIRVLKQRVISIAQERIMDAIKGQNDVPLFVKNWQKFLVQEVQDYAFTQVDRYFGVNLCANIDINIKTAVMRTLGQEDSFDATLACTIDAMVDDPNSWTVLKDGWDPYFASIEANNNLFGVYATALDRGVTSAAQKAKENEIKALAGGGFIAPEDENGDAKTSGALIEAVAKKAATLQFDAIVADQSVTGSAQALIGTLIADTVNNILNRL